MSIYDDLPEVAPPMMRDWAAVVLKTVTKLTDPLWVKIPGITDKYRFGPCEWMPRYEIDLVDVAESGENEHLIEMLVPLYPKNGDRCLVVFDNFRHPWVVVWWPTSISLPSPNVPKPTD